MTLKFNIPCKYCNGNMRLNFMAEDGGFGPLGAVVVTCDKCNTQGIEELDLKTIKKYLDNLKSKLSKKLITLIVKAASQAQADNKSASFKATII